MIGDDERRKRGKQRKVDVRVQCLRLPFGIKEPQVFEPEDEAAYYCTIYECNEKPYGVAVGRSFKWTY